MPDPEITIDEIAESFVERMERGETPSIEEYKAKYPALAKRIDAVLPALLMLEGIDLQPKQQKLAVDESIPEIIGDYQIIQEVGRGGMGVVFEARHTHMRRRVALKVLPKRLAKKPEYVARFLTECRSAGQLHHTNIVPVFEIGNVDGMHFYAMQFIHGENLDRVIEDVKRLRAESLAKKADKKSKKQKSFGTNKANSGNDHSEKLALSLIFGRQSDWPNADDQRENNTLPHSRENNGAPTEGSSSGISSEREDDLGLSDSVFGGESSSIARPGNVYHRRVAAVGIQVADALEHAHVNNVLHRDVKPANLILDTEGTVWITDFGLAKFEENHTQTGDVIGTLRYMPPERFSGKADARSDVYSLGLTLYELCTLRCAFEGVDRANLIKEVSNRTPVPPRAIDPTIPFDLETIILKSTQPQPERRYQSAQELAEDLRLFLADRPINGRRVTKAERFVRVCRRNPVASLMTFCILGLMIALSVVAVRNSWLTAAKAEAESTTRKESLLSQFESKVDEARLSQQSADVGQRFITLAAIRDAVELIPRLNLSEERKLSTTMDLRNQAISAMSLTDVGNIETHVVEEHWGLNQKTAFDFDYKVVAEGNLDGRVRVRFPGNDRDTIYLPEQDTPCQILKLSPNGRYLAVSHNDNNALYRDVAIAVWDLEHPEDTIFDAEGVVDFDFDNENKYLAISFFRENVEVISLIDEAPFVSISAPVNITPRCVRFSDNGDQIAISAGGEPNIYIYSVAHEPKMIKKLVAKDNVTAMDWRSENALLATGSRFGELSYWLNGLDGKPSVKRCHQDEINLIHIHPTKNLLASESIDQSIRISNLVADEESLELEGFEGLLACGFSKIGTLGHFNSQKNETGVWKIAEAEFKVLPNWNEESVGRNVFFHPSFDDLVIRTTNYGIEFWDLARHRIAKFLPCNHLGYFVLGHNQNFGYTCTIAGLSKWSIEISRGEQGFEITTGEPELIHNQHADRVGFDSSGKSLVIGTKMGLTVVDSNGSVVTELGRHLSVNSLQFSSDDRFVFSGTQRDKGAAVWNAKTGERVQLVLGQQPGVSVASHPSDPERFVTASQFLRKWNTRDWKGEIISDRLHQKNPVIRFSSDTNLIAYNNQSFNLVIQEFDSNDTIATFSTAESSRIVDFCFSPDGKRIAISCPDNLQVVNLQSIRAQLKALNLDW